MAFIPGNSGTASTFPDGFQIANGTVTAPTLKFADSQTGWYRPGLNQVALASAGVQTWLVDASGNHTIGVDGATLHTVTGVEFRRIAGNATANVTKSFYTGIGAGTLRATLGVAGATNGIVTGTIAGDFAINAATGSIVIGAAGSSIASATSAGAWTLGILTGSAITHNLYGGATNSGLSDVLRLTQLGTGPTLTGLLFSGRNTSGGIADYARVANTIEDSTAGTHSGGLKFYTALSGSVTEKGSVTSAGAWTLGPSGFNGVHTFNGPRTILSNNAQVYSSSVNNLTNGSTYTTNITIAAGGASGGLLMISYTGPSGVSGSQLWNTAIRVSGGAAPNVAATLINTTGASATLAITDNGSFVQVTNNSGLTLNLYGVVLYGNKI